MSTSFTLLAKRLLTVVNTTHERLLPGVDKVMLNQVLFQGKVLAALVTDVFFVKFVDFDMAFE